VPEAFLNHQDGLFHGFPRVGKVELVRGPLHLGLRIAIDEERGEDFRVFAPYPLVGWGSG
jgi:hypothetical protein